MKLVPRTRPADVAFMHYECELVAVIGKAAKNVKREDALQYLAGYTEVGEPVESAAESDPLVDPGVDEEV